MTDHLAVPGTVIKFRGPWAAWRIGTIVGATSSTMLQVSTIHGIEPVRTVEVLEVMGWTPLAT